MNKEKLDKLRTPPEDAKQTISAGRLKGKTDINPQWRIDAMNECFGLCGIGWIWSLVRTWREDGGKGQVFAFAEVTVKIKIDDEWSVSVPGTGGSFLVISEKNGPHANDDGYKMAITDALSVALKFFGVGAEIYRGHEKGKYDKQPESDSTTPGLISEKQRNRMFAIAKDNGWTDDAAKKVLFEHGFKNSKDVVWQDYEKICNVFGCPMPAGNPINPNDPKNDGLPF